MTTSDAYLAGFFDADGCVRITSPDAASSTNAFRLRVEVAQTSREVLDLFAVRFKGSVYGPSRPTPRAREVYRWRAVGQAAEEVLRALEPYMVVKKKRALLGLEARRLMTGRRLSEEQKQARWYYFHQMRVLNQRGAEN